MSTVPDLDLWPKAKFETDMVTPVAILRRQAALLGEKTQQLVTAEVSTTARFGTADHSFRLVVPALDNYGYELFTVSHGVEQLYPVTGYFGRETRLDDQSALLAWLKGVLSDESTLRKIDVLMAQAKG